MHAKKARQTSVDISYQGDSVGSDMGIPGNLGLNANKDIGFRAIEFPAVFKEKKETIHRTTLAGQYRQHNHWDRSHQEQFTPQSTCHEGIGRRVRPKQRLSCSDIHSLRHTFLEMSSI